MLIASRRFGPLFATQFLGAFNDNLFKTALILLITFQGGEGSALWVTAAAGVFILPFFLFSATAGVLADRHDKAAIARAVKIAEICLMLLAAAGFYFSHIPLLMLVLFGMGVHSAFFGPVKYAILPQHLAAGELLAGNAWVEAGTFIAILGGTVLAGVFAQMPLGVLAAAAAALALAAAGYAASRLIPPAPATVAAGAPRWNILADTRDILRQVLAAPRLRLSVLAVSWFWFTGATYLTQFPVFARDVLAGDAALVTAMLTVFSVGIAAGSFACNKWLKGRIDLSAVPAATLAMALFGIDLFFVPAAGARLFVDLFMIAAAGGFYVVPLYADIQRRAPAESVARVIGGLNVMNALLMTLSALGALLALAAGLTVAQLLLAQALLHIPVAMLLRRLDNGA